MTSLKKLAIKGTTWTVLGYGSSQFVRFVSNLILTRLLVPEYFGLMALVNTFLQGLSLFTDVGIGQNIIRSEQGDDPVFLNTAWTIQVLRGIFIWLVLITLAWPISLIYEEPQLFPVLLVISVTALLGGLASTRLYTLNRHLALGKITLLELSSQVIGIITMIAIAWFYPSVWALVIGAIVSRFFKTVASYLIFPGHKHKFTMNREARGEIVSFGRWIFLTSIIMFSAEQSDRIILGKLVPLEILGVYNIAYEFANIPQSVMKQMSFKVIFPLVSKQIELPRAQLKERLNRQRWKLHVGIVIIFVILVGFGDTIILFLYDDRYAQAAWMMPLLALGSWFSALFFIANPCLLALGKPVYSAQSRGLRFLVVALGILLGFKVAGIFGAVLVVALGDLPAYLSIQYSLNQEGIGCFRQDLRSTLLLLFVIGLVFLFRLTLGLGLPFDTLYALSAT